MTLEIGKKNETTAVLFDGACPVCRHFMCEMTTNKIKTVDARQASSLKDLAISNGFDLDKGIVLQDGEQMYYGSEAVRFILARQQSYSFSIRLMKILFKRHWMAKISYPLFVGLRRFLLWWNSTPLINESDESKSISHPNGRDNGEH